MSRESSGDERILSCLGLARRAGLLVLGQDRVFAALKAAAHLAVASSDSSKNVVRKLRALAVRHDSVCYVLPEVTREELGRAMGVGSAQVIALPLKGEIAKTLMGLLQLRGSCLNEQQNESV